jgi:hypothetical protein
MAPLTAVLALMATTAGKAESYHATILADQPVAYYRLEEQPGALTAVDSSSTGAFPGTYNYSANGLYPVLGEPGIDTNSVYFRSYVDDSGTEQDSYVEVPYAPELNTRGPFSAETWVRAMSVGAAGSRRSPVCNFGGWTGNAPGWFFYQTPESGTNLSAWVFAMQGGGVWMQAGPINEYQWEHLVATFDGTNASFYVNATLIETAAVLNYTPNSTNSFFIGEAPTLQFQFDGDVDEVAIYNRVLSTNQITTHYQVGLTNIRVVATPPSVTQDPASATNYAGYAVSFTVDADGTPPLFYQWYTNSTPIQGATDDTLTFVCAYADNGAAISAVVTNLYGSSTSAPATLTVSTDLLLTSSPSSIIREVGSAAAFGVVADGALPFSYQWYKATAPITGATNDILWLSDVQLTNDGATYYAAVSNPWNTTNSDAATLNVIPRRTVVPLTSYAKLVMADGPVAYWRLDQTNAASPAIDAAGSFDGTYDASGAGNYTNGSFTFGVPPGIPGETDTAISVTGGARVAVPWALELTAWGPFAAEGWFNPASLGVDAQDYRAVFSSLGSGPTGWFLYQQPDNTWAWMLFGGDWNTTLLITDTSDTVVTNSWYHIVLSYDGSICSVFVNGRLAVSEAWNAYIANRDGNINFGWDSSNDPNPFDGGIDDVAFYNHSLTLAQVQSHYAASVRLSVSRSGNNVVLSWPQGILQQASGVTGTYTNVTGAVSPYTNAPTGPASFYRVLMQ